MVTAAQAYDGGERSARESSTASPRPGRPLLLLVTRETTAAPTASQPALHYWQESVHQGILWVVPGLPAVEEMSRPPLQGLRSGVKTAARSNGTTGCQTFTPSKDGSIGVDGILRSSLGSRWAYMSVCVRRYRHGRRLLVSAPWGIAPLRPLPSLLLCCWGSTGARASTVVAVLLDGDGTFSSAVQDPRLAMARERRCRGVRWLGIE